MTIEKLKRTAKKSMTEYRGELARLSKGLAHPARIKIIQMLEKKPPNDRCICGDIVEELPLAQSSVSQHLKTLKETGWIHGEVDGPCVCYCLVDGIKDYFYSLLKKATGEP